MQERDSYTVCERGSSLLPILFYIRKEEEEEEHNSTAHQLDYLVAEESNMQIAAMCLEESQRG